MTKKDFFVIVIKLLGLYALIISIFNILPTNINFLTYDGKVDNLSLLLVLVTLIIMFGIMTYLLFKAEKIVEFLKLDKGFDEERIDLSKLNPNSILSIGLIFIGGFLILDNLAWFLSNTLTAFKTDLSGQVFDDYFKDNWMISGVNLVIGILLISNFKSISRFLYKRIEAN